MKCLIAKDVFESKASGLLLNARGSWDPNLDDMGDGRDLPRELVAQRGIVG